MNSRLKDFLAKEMGEPEVKIDQENKIFDKEEENIENDTDLVTNNNSTIAELNLVLILSFLSLSSEECSNLDQINERESEAKHNNSVSKSNFPTRKQQVNSGFRAVERPSSKVHTKIRDCRT
ncbi:hypothetical protein BUALT_Bualt19G0005100 [Buddleja alternifolia]|uniref:Uncharacterized protein n=1 Tax=Buddleja alternifolia TaxID=168488 RepID=A0AAV6W6A4_9LAMI|nr:hypothetical protein BUALT_Bualt19G0005100 [Buddleja alternifolia]